MRRVTGLPDEQVLAWESKLEAQVVASLQAVMDKIAARIEKIQVASGLSTMERAERAAGAPAPLRHNDSCSPDSPHWTQSPYPGVRDVLVAVATTGPTGDDDPPPMTGELAIPEPVPLPEVLPQTPGLPPGQPYISPDDLASITPLWQSEVVNQVLPLVAQVFIDSAGHLRSQMLDHVAPGVVLGVPGLGSVAAESYLAQARNTYEQVGDHLWATARAQLSEGFEAGESIPQLSARLRQSAGLSARTATMVARTSVIEASNAGSMSMARASGVELLKSWQATNDLRTRPAHLAAEAQYEADPIPLSQPFIVGGYPAQFPAADTLPPAQRYRCRCTTLYLMPDKVEAPPQPGLAELPGTSGVAEIEAPPAVPDIETEAFPKLPGEAGFDLGDFPEPPPLKVRSSLLRARTDRELIAAWQGEMRAITGRDIIVQLPPDASILTMREHAEGVLQMLERFPEARLRKISWFDQGGIEYAHVKVDAATLEFNAQWASTAHRRDYLASLRKDVAGWDSTTEPGYSWSVRGGSRPQATSWHEMAHILSLSTLGGKLKAEAMRIALKHMSARGFTIMESVVTRDISGYATKNLEEMIAEAMTDVMANGPRASLLSRELYDMVAREYRAKGFAVRTAELPEGGLGFEDFTREGEAFPKLPAPKPLARMTVAELRAQAKARGITVPAGTRKADLVRMLDEAPPSPVASPVSAAIPAAVRLRAGAVSDPSTWRAEAVEGVAAPRGALAAFTSYVRQPGFVNMRLRIPVPDKSPSGWRTWVHDASPDELIGRAPFDEAAEAAARSRADSMIKAIDDVMEESRSTAPFTTWRGVDVKDISLPAGRSIGYEWRDDGFVSTSETRSVAEGSFGGGPGRLTLEIRSPAGTPSVRIVGLGEDEVLLARGMTYRVVEDDVVDGVRRVVVDAVPTTRPSVPVSTALPARVVAARTELARVVEGPVVREPYSVGGASAKNTRIGYSGGDVIEKDYTRGTRSQGVRDADAEELGALVMDALDVPTQTVLRAGPQRVIVSVLEGEHPGDVGPLAPGAAREALADTDGGRLLGLGDVLIGNSDRRRNWVRLPDGRPASYDLGGAFRAPKLAGAADPEGLFAHHFATTGGKAWAPNDMSPGDLALIRERLEALRPEFERLKRTTWFTQMVGRLAEVERRATGTRSRLGGSIGPEVRGFVDGAAQGQRALDAVPPLPVADGFRIHGDPASAIRSYRRGSDEINETLRGTRRMTPEAQYEIRDLDEVMDASRLTERVAVYRATPARTTFDLSREDLTGTDWTDAGYTSTTASERVADRFASSGDVRMRIVVPRGTQALRLSDMPTSDTGRINLDEEAELLLGRGTRFRVVADRGWIEVTNSNTGRLVRVRDIDVEVNPTGPLVPTAPTLGERAVARQSVIDERRAVAESLGEVRELLANGASERALASRARLIAGRTSGVAGEDLAGVVRAMESGDADRIRVAIGDVAQRRNLTEVGPGGGADVVPFDPKIHELVGGAKRPPAGTFVQVMRPGYSVRLDDGEVVQLGKAKVDTLTAEEIATRTAAQERKALREATRERARVVEAQRATAKLLAEVDELAAKGATKTAIRERLDPALREAGQAYAGADAAAVDALSAALDSGDLAKVRAAVTRAGTKAKIKPIGRAGAKTTFDPDTMEGVGGIDIAPGARVTVVRRGSRIEGIETPEKAQVTPVRAASTAKTVAKGDFTGLTRVGPQLGSNPGGIFEAGDGSRWYIKTARDPEQLRSEALALDFYRAAGIDVPDVVLGQGVTDLGGGTQIASRIIEGATSDLRQRLADEAYRRSLSEGFAVDAWLGNWDVLGQGLDNVLTTAAGLPIRIEAGGALRFRALGESKDFGPLVTELESMRAAGRSAGRAFSGMTSEEVIASAERVRKITPAKIKALVKRHDLDPELAETLIERRANLLAQSEALAGPKPMTPAQYAAAIKAAAKGQDALDAVEAGVAGHTPDIPGQPVHTIWRGIDDDDIKSAIDRYISNDYDFTNGALRGLPQDLYERQAREIAALMDRALERSRLTVDAVLWRAPGSGRSIFGDPGAWGDDLAGFEWSDSAYSSTSAVKRVADRFIKDGGVRLRILAPKGSRTLQLSPETSSLAQYEESAAEAEVLLARGARFRVVKDRGWTEIAHPSTRQRIRVRDLDVEAVVPDKTPPLPWETK